MSWSAPAAPFRKLAAELGETPAALAHRYALTAPGVATIILGVKNRAELAECVAAETRGVPRRQRVARAVITAHTPKPSRVSARATERVTTTMIA